MQLWDIHNKKNPQIIGVYITTSMGVVVDFANNPISCAAAKRTVAHQLSALLCRTAH